MIADEIPIHSGTEHQLQTLWPDKPECQTILRIMAFQYHFTQGEDESHFAVKLAATKVTDITYRHCIGKYYHHIQDRYL